MNAGNLMMQGFEWFWQQGGGFFTAYNPFTWITIGIMAVGAAFAALYFLRHKKPLQGARFMGEALLTMKVGEVIRGTLYELEEWMHEPNIEALNAIEEARPVAQLLLKMKKDGNLWLGVLDVNGEKGGTLTDGVAIIASNINLFDRNYSKDTGSYYSIARGEVHVKMINQALSPGRVYRNVPDFIDGKTVHVIYYPCPSDDDSKVINVIQNPDATIGIFAQVKAHINAMRDVREFKAKISALEQNLENATSEITRQSRQGGWLQIQLAKKSPFQGMMQTMTNPLSAMVVLMLMIGAGTIGPELIRGWHVPPVDELQLRLESLFVGALIVGAIMYFRGNRQ